MAHRAVVNVDWEEPKGDLCVFPDAVVAQLLGSVALVRNILGEVLDHLLTKIKGISISKKNPSELLWVIFDSGGIVHAARDQTKPTK